MAKDELESLVNKKLKNAVKELKERLESQIRHYQDYLAYLERDESVPSELPKVIRLDDLASRVVTLTELKERR